jgi:hypothetical protein
MPEAQRIKIINQHSYALCQDQGVDPIDFERCDHWIDYLGGGRVSYGRFKVFVAWPGGQTALRDLDVETLQAREGEDRKFEIRQ